MKADLIAAGGRIYPVGRWGLRAASHLAVAGGRVIAAGGEEVLALGGPATRRLDLGGGALLPGFDDAHAHVVYYGLTSFGADLTGCRSIPELLRRLAAHCARLAPEEWCLGRGYSVLDLGEGRAPTRQEMDMAVGDRPAFIDERGGHARVAGSAALAAAGVSGETPDPAGGRIGRAPDGLPDGRLYESAMRLVADHQPPPDLGRRRRGILRAQRLLLSRGITSVGAAVNRGFADDLVAFQQLEAEGRLRMRVNEFLSWELLPAASRLGVRAGFGSRLVRAGPVKVFVDGGAGAGAARLRSGQGVWRTPPDELSGLVARAQAAGLQVAVHAIGDGAIEAMLDAVEAAGPAARRARHRIEHCTVCPPDLRRRAAALGVVAVMQPLFLRFGRERAVEALGAADPADIAAHRELARAGVHLAFSSDLPVAPDPNPWLGMAAAVLDPQRPLTVLQAVRAYTSGGAYAAFQEHRRGTLEPGMVADFQVLKVDPFSLPPGRWERLRPHAVAVEGVFVWGR